LGCHVFRIHPSNGRRLTRRIGESTEVKSASVESRTYDRRCRSQQCGLIGRSALLRRVYRKAMGSRAPRTNPARAISSRSQVICTWPGPVHRSRALIAPRDSKGHRC
jgi:hypothetical protein